MQIQIPTYQTSQTNERQAQVKSGEKVAVTVTEKHSSTEATVLLKGREVKAHFPEGVPSQSRSTVEVVAQKDGAYTLKELPTRTSQNEQALTNQQQVTDIKGSPDLKRALEILRANKIPLSQETIRAIQTFLSEGKDASNRMATIDALAQKRLEPTIDQLRSIHQTLHQGKYSDLISELKIKPISVREHPIISAALRDLLSNRQHHANTDRMVQLLQQVSQQALPQQNTANIKALVSLIEGHRSQFSAPNQLLLFLTQFAEQGGSLQQGSSSFEQSRLSTPEHANNQGGSKLHQAAASLHGIERSLQTDANLSQVMEQVRSFIHQQVEIFGPVNEQTLSQKLEQASTFLASGRELKARTQLNELVQQIQAIVNPANATLEVQTPVMQQGKQIAVTTVTEQMAQLTDRFQQTRRDLVRHLDVWVRQQEFIPNTKQSKPLLETAIKKLDHMMMKSEMLLFTDMQTERSLLKMSSQLQEARTLLQSGQFQQAKAIVQQVQKGMETLVFKPSETKVHYMTEQNGRANQTATPSYHLPSSQEASARGLYEQMRQLGLSREVDIAQGFSARQSVAESSNIKAQLMQILQYEQEGSRQHQAAQQALQNLTGQQLLSRTDAHNHLQSLMIQIPYLLGGDTENIQLFLKSRQQGEQLDWENCSLYFLLETKKLGELGISISVSNRQLSVLLKSDHPLLEQRLAPLANEATSHLQEIGFNVHAIKFERLNEVNKQNEQSSKQELIETPQQAVFTEKGFDYKI